MDTMKSHNLKAKKKKEKERDCLFQNILLHLLTTLTCALLGSYLFSAPESFVLVSFLQWKPVLANAKTLFLVANLIALFLMGGYGFRRASKGPSSSAVDDLYDEYVERSKRLWVTRVQGTGENCGDEKREEKDEGRAPEVQLEPAKDEGERISNTGDEFEELQMAEPAKGAVDDMRDSKLDEGSESNKLATEEPTRRDMLEPSALKLDKSGESNELPREELTRRVDEFIARVNKRRLLESRSQ